MKKEFSRQYLIENLDKSYSNDIITWEDILNNNKIELPDKIDFLFEHCDLTKDEIKNIMFELGFKIYHDETQFHRNDERLFRWLCTCNHNQYDLKYLESLEEIVKDIHYNFRNLLGTSDDIEDYYIFSIYVCDTVRYFKECLKYKDPIIPDSSFPYCDEGLGHETKQDIINYLKNL